MKSQELNQKVAFVTGGSRGIGQAICKKLGSSGVFTIIHYNKNSENAERLRKEIREKGGSAEIIQSDLETIEGIESCSRQLLATMNQYNLSGLDILVNNAGVGIVRSMTETDENIFDKLFAINVKAPFFLTQKLLSRINNGGRIINISSVVTRFAIPSVGAYSMTKGAINTMTLWLAKELGPRKITVNAIAPGIIDTDMNKEALSDQNTKKYMESLSVFGRVGEPEDIADAVLYLASDSSRWTTGQIIDVSGGTHLG